MEEKDTGGKIIMRRALLADVDRITDIENLSFAADAFSRRRIIYLIRKSKGMFYVALSDNEISGYVSLLHRSASANLRIYSIAVHPSFRGMGIADRLISEAKDYAVENQIGRITLEVRTDNISAIALYKKSGFEISGRLEGYYEDNTDAYRMELFTG